MTLIKSISGIRGTIGGKKGDNLTAEDIVKFASAYGSWLQGKFPNKKLKVVIGRDARMSGAMLSKLVEGTLSSLGINVVNLGLSTTPTVELAVPMEGADGGIILTASHNPKQWNALKLLNQKGEFISAQDGKDLLEIAESGNIEYASVDELGVVRNDDTYLEKHIQHILELEMVDVEAIRKSELSIVVECVNSTGGVFLPKLLKALGVKEVHELYCEPNGKFPHNPEPLKENLGDISKEVKRVGADLGMVVDPDVDRLAMITEEGEMFGEEYTLVAVADYVLKHHKGAAVSNLSSSRALRDVCEKYGTDYFASAVGEVNVVEKMKEVGAVIGGEGNGGVIYPSSHYGRDALVGAALFLSHFAHFRENNKKTCSALKASYECYHISKNKIELQEGMDVDGILRSIEERYEQYPKNTIDGLKIDFEKEWVHLRKSNTEPIIRIYSESASEEKANELAEKIIADIRNLI